jgi:hypothetical protein
LSLLDDKTFIFVVFIPTKVLHDFLRQMKAVTTRFGQIAAISQIFWVGDFTLYFQRYQMPI